MRVLIEVKFDENIGGVGSFITRVSEMCEPLVAISGIRLLPATSFADTVEQFELALARVAVKPS